MKWNAWSLLALSGMLFSACAVQEKKQSEFADDARLGEAVDSVCFTGGLSGFYSVGDQALVLRDGPGRSYLVETGFCPNLRLVEGLRLDDPSNCLRRGDRLSVFDTPLPEKGFQSDRPDHCTVTMIFEWHPDREEEPAQDQSVGQPES